jgi:lambda repressor-like predicted transcriptional regulator
VVKRTRWLAAAALAVVLGGGAALAATGSSNPAPDFVGDVAERLGISRDKLEDAIEDATIARIDAAVAAGEITKEEAEELKERVRSGDVAAVPPSFRGPGPGVGPLPAPGAFAPGRLAGTDLLATAADYLGMDETDVREALRDGGSLADLAKDKGKSIDGLKQALRDAIRKDADQAVDDGALTKEQADRLVQKLSRAVDEFVEKGGCPGLEFGFPGQGFGHGPPAPLERGIVPGAFPGTDLMETAADYLGMDGADLREALSDGRSLANLAKDKGKSVDGLKQALRDAIRRDADRAVEDGALTKQQADRLVAKFGNEVDELVEKGPGGGFDLDLRRGGGKFEFHLRVGPEGPVPPPEAQAKPSFEPPLAPPQPI